MRIFFYLFLIITLFSYVSAANENKIIVASTTSTSDTGLLDYLNSFFYEKYDIKVNVISVGTGQAIRLAKDGNIDVLIVHHTPSEIDFISKGYGLVRHNFMYNDYVLVGPKNDKNYCNSIESKLIEIHNNKFNFISRGDDSGTNKKEIELWKIINLNFYKFSSWYLKIGQGMGATLLMANEKKAYTLSDRGTWISFNRKDNLHIVCENMPPLFNQYGLILVNPSINKNLNTVDSKKYIDWLLSKEAKRLINNFKVDDKQLFFYNNH